MNPSVIITIGGVAGYLCACLLSGRLLPVLSLPAFVGTFLGVAAAGGVMAYFGRPREQKWVPKVTQSTLEKDEAGQQQPAAAAKPKEDGLYGGSATPQVLLGLMANGDPEAAAEIYQLGLEKRYPAILFRNLALMNDENRGKVYLQFSGAPEGFRSAMRKAADVAVRKQVWRFIYGGFFFILCGLFTISAIQSLDFSMGFTGVFGLIIDTFVLYAADRGRRVARELKSCLKEVA